jgi:hypothetical protein
MTRMPGSHDPPAASARSADDGARRNWPEDCVVIAMSAAPAHALDPTNSPSTGTFRRATCGAFWIENSDGSFTSTNGVYLVVHSQRRSVVRSLVPRLVQRPHHQFTSQMLDHETRTTPSPARCPAPHD